MSKPEYTKPTSQLDLEARQADGYEPHGVLHKGEELPKSENGFVGVDPIYQNFADETHRPLSAEGGAESEYDSEFLTEDADSSLGATPESVEGVESDDEDDTDGNVEPSTPVTPPSQSNLF